MWNFFQLFKTCKMTIFSALNLRLWINSLSTHFFENWAPWTSWDCNRIPTSRPQRSSSTQNYFFFKNSTSYNIFQMKINLAIISLDVWSNWYCICDLKENWKRSYWRLSFLLFGIFIVYSSHQMIAWNLLKTITETLESKKWSFLKEGSRIAF